MTFQTVLLSCVIIRASYPNTELFIEDRHEAREVTGRVRPAGC